MGGWFVLTSFLNFIFVELREDKLREDNAFLYNGNADSTENFSQVPSMEQLPDDAGQTCGFRFLFLFINL